MADWKEMLGQLRNDLPEGEDVAESCAENDAACAKEVQQDALRVVIDKKGRKGKVATIVEGFTLPDEEVEELAARLKRKLGVGGSARGGEILIQGDAATRVRDFLKAEGFKVK